MSGAVSWVDVMRRKNNGERESDGSETWGKLYKQTVDSIGRIQGSKMPVGLEEGNLKGDKKCLKILSEMECQEIHCS